jgi:hypothetical protein
MGLNYRTTTAQACVRNADTARRMVGRGLWDDDPVFLNYDKAIERYRKGIHEVSKDRAKERTESAARE